MAEYRYIFADLLTNVVNAELPLYGTSFGRRLNKAGNFQGAFGLDSSGYANKDVIEATSPGKTACYVERNGSLVWGGIIWSRTYQEQSKTIQLTGQTFESYFYKADIRNSIGYTNVDQRNIIRSLISACQAYPNRNLGIIIPAAFPNNILRTVQFHNYEAWSFGKALDSIAEYEEGLDWTIDVSHGASGPEKSLLVNNKLGASISSTQLIFDYPGAIKNFWYPENAAKGATTVHGIGAGEGSKMPRIVWTNQKLLDAGFPELVEFYTNKDVTSASTLASKTRKEAVLSQVPITVPTYELNSESEPQFGSYQLGDYARVIIQSPRFPDGLHTYTRIIGWDVTPSQSTSQEQVKIIVAGEEDE